MVKNTILAMFISPKPHLDKFRNSIKINRWFGFQIMFSLKGKWISKIENQLVNDSHDQNSKLDVI